MLFLIIFKYIIMKLINNSYSPINQSNEYLLSTYCMPGTTDRELKETHQNL